ncbi:MAG: hypothetical protein M5U01_17975 [Ardenticatenaceae bacterium]|nr:hypothetical protein [Ardenticatenaceae bacterium]HBY96560.1 hypothetical protein [Chloroflexota bacterium]
MSEISRRLDFLVERLRTAYDGIGHSSGRPYVYFVYPPEQELAVRRLVDESLRDDGILCYHHIDLLPLTIESLAGQEKKRQELLNDPTKGAAVAIVRLWARALGKAIAKRLEHECQGRPVVVLRGLAALHPLGNPTSLMEALAEQEPRDPKTNRIVPIVLLVPGTRPAQTSRTYLFLGLERLRLEFYRGEEA